MKQIQHRRKYKSGKITIVNRGINRRPRIQIIQRKKVVPIVAKPEPIKITARIPLTQAEIKAREAKTELQQAAEFFGMKVGEPMSGYMNPLEQGHLVKYLIPIDFITTKRWYFYAESILRNKIVLPIPQIEFGEPSNDAKKNLKECIDYAASKGYFGSKAVELLMEWILWGFGDPIQEKPPEISDEINKFWYTKFNFGLMMQHPADYMAWMLGEYGHKGGPGWFATPLPVCQMISDITNNDTKPWQSVMDPCVGTGSMLLPASNKSLNLYGNDISTTMVKAAHINGWLFVPWLVKPFPKYLLDKLKEQEEGKNANK